MKGIVGNEMQQHPETRKGSPGNKQKQGQEKQTKTKKDKLMASRHEKIGKASGEGDGMKRKNRMDNEKEENWNEEQESRAGQEAAGNTNGLLMSPDCEGPVSQKISWDENICRTMSF
jgi:hypothetical protein